MNIRIKQAASTILAGGIIAYPTEAVWGLGCDPFNESAVNRLLDLKKRSRSKGLILIAGDLEQVRPLLNSLTKEQYQRVVSTWPGPNTWIIPANGKIPEWVTGNHQTVAVRVTEHPLVRSLCAASGQLIVSTSANHSGQQAARTALRVRLAFGQQLDYILPGLTMNHDRPSTIKNAITGKQLR